ncbi:hypothetical protein ACWF94_24850 [Streptomyces sp. NPDC055078]
MAATARLAVTVDTSSAVDLGRRVQAAILNVLNKAARTTSDTTGDAIAGLLTSAVMAEILRVTPEKVPPDTARPRTHIKAIAIELKRITPELNPEGQGFISGALTGLSMAARILNGASAESAMEEVVQRLDAAVGQAIGGDTPPPDATPDDATPDPVHGVQAWMALDLHTALRRSIDNQAEHQGHASWADWWAELLADVRRMADPPGLLHYPWQCPRPPTPTSDVPPPLRGPNWKEDGQ